MTVDGARDPRAMSGDERLEIILATAKRMFHEQGYRAVSIRDLADAVGIKMSSLYYYFPSKEDILYRIVKDHLDRLQHVVARVVEESRGLSALERLRALISESVLALIDNREAAGVSLLQTRELADPQRSELGELTNAYQKVFENLVAEGIRSGEFIDTDPIMATYVILAALTRVSLWYQPGGRLSPEEIAGDYSVLLTRTVDARPSPAPAHPAVHARTD